MLRPIPRSADLLAAVKEALGPGRLPLIIGIDGRGGSGKTSLAGWLTWQIGYPSVHLDLYIIRDSKPLEWRYEDLGRAVHARLNTKRPIIIEGVCVCAALQALDLEPDFLVWLENRNGPVPGGPRDPTPVYIREFSPRQNADFRLIWRSPDHLASTD